MIPAQPEKTALVTGANRGIGREIARQLAKAGAHTLMTGRNRKAVAEAVEELRSDGLPVEALELDVASSDSIRAAADEVARRFGRLDILVNNAGIRVEEYGKLPSQQPLHQWRETFESNLFGVVEVTCALLPLLRASPAGRIVNVASMLASLTRHSDPDSYTYSATFRVRNVSSCPFRD